MQLFQFQGYFWKVLATFAAVSVGFLIIMMSTMAYFMVVPLGQRATDDLASIISHAAETWEKQPIEKRDQFVAQMWRKHNLVLSNELTPLPETSSMLPYLYFLERSLQKQMDPNIRLKSSFDKQDEEWFWADIPLKESTLRFGFSRSRIGVEPSLAFIVLLITGVLLTFITASLLTRRLTVTIERLYLAAQLMGKGQWPEPVQEEGPEELQVLAKEFNRMNLQMKELLNNRTTLLAGISHDLRTPLTQIQLALSMLPDKGGDSELMDSILFDLDEINRLIGETLSISMELAEEDCFVTDITLELNKLIEKLQHDDVSILWMPGDACFQTLQPLAFRRVITNLISNALRYGANKPVEVDCSCEKDKVTIRVMDRGNGIPAEHIEAVFQPFYRLEASRSSSTGGSGLGLAIVRQLVDANGWDIVLLSRSGGGTIAELTIRSRN